MGANLSSRPQTQRDVARFSSQVIRGSQFELSPTVTGTQEFPDDTEEVTGSNPVRPTRHFLFLALQSSVL